MENDEDDDVFLAKIKQKLAEKRQDAGVVESWELR